MASEALQRRKLQRSGWRHDLPLTAGGGRREGLVVVFHVVAARTERLPPAATSGVSQQPPQPSSSSTLVRSLPSLPHLLRPQDRDPARAWVSTPFLMVSILIAVGPTWQMISTGWLCVPRWSLVLLGSSLTTTKPYFRDQAPRVRGVGLSAAESNVLPTHSRILIRMLEHLLTAVPASHLPLAQL